MSETPGQVLKRLYREHGMQWEPGWHLDDDFEGLAAAFLAEMDVCPLCSNHGRIRVEQEDGRTVMTLCGCQS